MRATDRPAVRLACLLDGSRMSREVHVRFCERPVVQSRQPTQQRFQSPSFAQGHADGQLFSDTGPRLVPSGRS
jgi:hypothetical protein